MMVKLSFVRSLIMRLFDRVIDLFEWSVRKT